MTKVTTIKADFKAGLRGAGNTTRAVDAIIQQLFNGESVLLIEPVDTTFTNRHIEFELIRRLKNRLKKEHSLYERADYRIVKISVSNLEVTEETELLIKALPRDRFVKYIALCR